MHILTRSILAGLLLSLSSFLMAATPTFEPADCPFEVPNDTTGLICGYVEVPENRAKPEGRKLRLAVAILESFSKSPEPDPLVFLSGGPGEASLRSVPWRMSSSFWHRYRQDRDLVFYDQRGTGFSDPAFCTELNLALYTTAFQGLAPNEQHRQELAAIEDCRDKMLAEGIDFAHYNSNVSAHDLADLRRALGIEEWNVFGISYGTRLALVTLREAPEGIRSIIIDSVYPPNGPEVDDHVRFARSLRLAFDRCAADTACQATFPQLEQEFFAMLADLEADPIEIAMADIVRFPEGRIVVDGSLIATGVFQGFYDGDFVEVFPLLVREVNARNEDVLRALADGLVQDPHGMSQGLLFAVQCNEGFGRATPGELAADRAAHPELGVWTEGRNTSVLCEAWHGERAAPAFGEPVYSEVPTLLITGDYDPITPPANARLAMETLPNSTLVVVPGEGHAAITTRECTQDLAARFLADPGKELATKCVGELPAPQFITQVHVTPGISRFMAQASGNGMPAPILALGAMVLLLASVLIVWPLGWLWRRLRGRTVEHPVAARRARWVAALTASLGLGFLGLLALAVFGTLSDNPYLLAFGLPVGHASIFLLPWAVLLAALVTASCAVAAWRSRWWGTAARIHYSLVAIAGLAFVAWAGSLGFI